MKKYLNESPKTLILFLIDKLLRRPNLDRGLLLTTDKKVEQDGDFIFQPLGWSFSDKRVIKEDGNYEDFLPNGERQNRGQDKLHCVSEGGCNTIEEIVNYCIHLVKTEKADDYAQKIERIFRALGFIKIQEEWAKIDPDYIVTDPKREMCRISTRHVAAGSGTTIRGNLQKNVGDFIRHYGLVPYDVYPYVYDYNDYYYTGDVKFKNNNRLPKEVVERGKEILKYIEFTYEWVKPQDIPATAKYGSMAVVGASWYRDTLKNGVYQRNDYPANHVFSWVKEEVTKIIDILDSYEPFRKRLAANFFKNSAQLFTMRVVEDISERTKWLEKGKKFVIRADNKGEFYVIKKDGLEYIPTKEAIQAVIKTETSLNLDIKELKELSKLEFINEELFNKLNQ